MMPDNARDDIGQHLKAMRAFAVSLTHDPALADDIVQDAVTRAWLKFDQYEPGTNLRAWLFTILRNTFYSHVRKHRLVTESLEDTPPANLALPPEHDTSMALRDFMVAFRTLSFEQREVLLLVGALGFTYEEAASLCETPVGTLKSRVHRARRILAERLDALEHASEARKA